MDVNSVKASTLDGVTLAYIGDCVMELYIRRKLILSSFSGSRDLNAAAQSLVSAHAQFEVLRRIEPMLTEEEAEYFRRGRNCGHQSYPKHAKMSDYRIATGLEALLGFLYLSGREERITELLDAGVVFPGKPKST